MEAFGKAFEVFVLLINLSILGFLVYCWVQVIRKRKGIFGRLGWLKGFLALAFLLFITLFFVMVLVSYLWWEPVFL